MPKENSKVLKERERELPLGERRISHFFGPFNGSGVVVFSGCDFYSKGKRMEKETWEQEFSHRMTLILIYLHLRWEAGKRFVYNRVYMRYMYIYIYLPIYLYYIMWAFIYIYISYLPTPLLGFESIQNGLQVHLDDFFPRKRSEFLLGKAICLSKSCSHLHLEPSIHLQLTSSNKKGTQGSVWCFLW